MQGVGTLCLSPGLPAERSATNRPPDREASMTGIFSKLIDYMEEENWKYEILEGETIIRFHFKGSAGRLLCYGEVDEAKHWLIFYAYLPVNCPPEKTIDLAEFLTRANRGMRIGNFEMDYDDGEIRYKTSLDIEGGDLSSKMVDNLLRANLSTVNRYFAGIMELIYGEKSPVELIAKIESPSLTDDDAIDSESFGQDDSEDEEEEETPYASDDEDEDEK
jgi:hypothetical protein